MWGPALALVLSACQPKHPPPTPTPTPTPPEAHPQHARLIYFVMVDRFANGDPSNDAAVDPADPQAFHGGDLRGVQQHLDDLVPLGVTDLWLSPIFAMRTDKIDAWGAFHGYWVRDLARIEPRFGDDAALRSLVEAAHARGMRVLLDMVWNHTDYDAPLRQEHPDWFHPTGDIEDWNDPEQRITGQVHGLPDLAQEKPEVLDYLAAVSTGWIDRSGVDGFRIDAVGHMPLPALSTLNSRLDAHRPGFFTLGEDFSGDPARLSATLDQGQFDALFDFPLRYALVDVFCKGAPLGRIASTLSLDRLYRDPSALVTFLDNHDLKRIHTECSGRSSRVRQALTFLYATRGIPSLTWGTELDLPGGEEPDNRRDMPWAALQGGSEPSTRSLLRRLAALRSAWPVLHSGRSIILGMGEDWLSIGRFSDHEAARVLLWTGSRPPAAEALGFEAAGADLQLFSSFDAELGVEISLFRAAPGANPGWAPFLQDPPTVHLRIDLPATEGDLRVVGAGPELGHWDPAKGLRPVDGAVSVALPAGSVAAYKIVHMDGEGVIWPDGPDTVVLLPWAPQPPSPPKAGQSTDNEIY